MKTRCKASKMVQPIKAFTFNPEYLTYWDLLGVRR